MWNLFSNLQEKSENTVPDRNLGIVDQPIQPGKVGRVKHRATFWPARCLQEVTLLAGQPVQIREMNGITLLVEPVGSLRDATFI